MLSYLYNPPHYGTTYRWNLCSLGLGVRLEIPDHLYSIFVSKRSKACSSVLFEQSLLPPCYTNWQMVLSLHFPQDLFLPAVSSTFCFYHHFSSVYGSHQPNEQILHKARKKRDLWSFCPPPELGSTAFSQLLRNLSLLLSEHHPQGWQLHSSCET